MDAARLVGVARRIQVDLQIRNWLQGGADLEILIEIGGGWRHYAVGRIKPAVRHGFLDIAVACESKSEIESRLQPSATVLTEIITDTRHEARQGHVVAVGVRHVDTAHHHEHSRSELQRLIPTLVFRVAARCDGEFQMCGIARRNLNFIIV